MTLTMCASTSDLNWVLAVVAMRESLVSAMEQSDRMLCLENKVVRKGIKKSIDSTRSDKLLRWLLVSHLPKRSRLRYRLSKHLMPITSLSFSLSTNPTKQMLSPLRMYNPMAPLPLPHLD